MSTKQNYQAELPNDSNDLFRLNQYPIFDVEETIKQFEDKEAFIEILNDFLVNDLQLSFAKMKIAFLEKDYEQVEKLAHRIKSGALYMGTVRTRYACQYLGRYWKTGRRELFSKLYEQAVSVIDETERQVHDWLKKAN